jgi:hypothetical protein
MIMHNPSIFSGGGVATGATAENILGRCKKLPSYNFNSNGYNIKINLTNTINKT